MISVTNAMRDWRVQIKSEELYKAALDKKTYHESRLDFWRKKAEDLKVEIKEKGLEFYELDGGYSNTRVSGGGVANVGVQMDKSMSENLRDYINKTNEHSGLVDYFESLVSFLSRVPKGNMLECDIDTIKQLNILEG